MRSNSSALRQVGQASLQSCFFSKSSSRLSEDDKQGKPSKQSISLADFLNRKLVKTSGRSIQEKQNSFSPIGSDKDDSRPRRDGLILDSATFRQFGRTVRGEGSGGTSSCAGDVQDSRKRKNPFGDPLGDAERPAAPKHLVVLGDDPKPRLVKREKNLLDKTAKPFYNHYENGCGWWDGDQEGVDSEEVGCNEAWEGMGSTTLGGLEWH